VPELRHLIATESARTIAGRGHHADEKALYEYLRTAADGEFLLSWSAELPAFDSLPVRNLRDAGLIFTYRGGKSHSPHCYVVGMYEPGDDAGPGSTCPPPSIQTGASWLMFARRDRHTCHLCGQAVVNDWQRPKENRSLDHLIPRSRGGTNYPSNMRLAHISCNKGRRNRDAREFREWLALHRRRGDRHAWTVLCLGSA
jgi:hypothetical protein